MNLDENQASTEISGKKEGEPTVSKTACPAGNYHQVEGTEIRVNLYTIKKRIQLAVGPYCGTKCDFFDEDRDYPATCRMFNVPLNMKANGCGEYYRCEMCRSLFTNFTENQA